MPALFRHEDVTARLMVSLPADWPQFCEAVRDHLSSHFGLADETYSLGWATWCLLMHEHADRRLVVGLTDPLGRLIGMIDAVPDYSLPREWCIALMLLRPEYRSNGLGSGLYQAFERWAIGQGAENFLLGVVEDNASGRAFWRKQGFERVRAGQVVRMGARTHALVLKTKCFTEGRRSEIAGHLADQRS
jgi:GNAT superfamily N-acetyltransferase